MWYLTHPIFLEIYPSPFLYLNDLEKLRHAVISSSINYRNVLVCGVPAPLSIKLIQNSAARKWMWASKYDYIISASFHWCIVNAHTDYKVLVSNYQIITLLHHRTIIYHWFTHCFVHRIHDNYYIWKRKLEAETFLL